MSYSRITICAILSLFLSTAAGGTIAQTIDLDRGHRVLLEHGLQLQAQVSVAATGYFDLNRWQESNFTTLDSIGLPYESTLMPPSPGIPWATSGLDANHVENDLGGLPYMSMLRTMGLGGENLPIQVPANREMFKANMATMHQSWPDVITYTNQGPRHNTAEQLRDYMLDVQPDMLFSGSYPFGGTEPAGGSPANLYGPLEKYRVTSLVGNDGTGNEPIPFGFYTQTWVNDNYPPAPGYVLSESELRLNDFALWTFGAKVKTNFIYDWRASHLLPVLFNGQGTNSPTPLFHQVVETNRQSLNLGPALVRLVSTDVRFIDGRHLDGGVVTYNELPHYIDVPSDPPVFLSTWDNAADPYMMDVFATNPGSKNDGLEGDVIVGFFKPLHPCFTNAGHADDVYFMVLNGLSDPNGTPTETSQQIHVGFDFGTSGISSLQRMSRDTGLVEIVNLDHDGGSQYHLDLTIEGGTADLFKFNNGGEFVANNITVSPEFTWTADGMGDWMLPDSWERQCDAPPNNSMHTAVFGDSPSITRSTVAVVTSPVTVNRIEFDNSSDSYAIVGLHHVRFLTNADTLELPAIDVLNGTHEFQASVELVNSTTVNVASNATLFFNNSVNLLGSALTKTGLGEIVFGNALITSGGTFNCNEGSCSGSAAISGDVNNNGGTVSPGSSPGVLPVDGNYSQSEAGTLLIELAGTEAGTMHDVLKVAGLASLGGKLDVVLLDAFQPYVGDRFDILDFSSLTGEFTQLSFPDLPSGFAWDDSELYSTGTISVSFVPEPGCHALLILCGFVIMFLRVQKRSYSN